MMLPENFHCPRSRLSGLMDDLCWNTAELADGRSQEVYPAQRRAVAAVSINASMRSLHNLDFPMRLMTLARKV